MSTRKKYDPRLKPKIVLELLKEEKTVSQLASEHGIHHSVLIRWRDQAVNGLPELLSDQNKSLSKVRAEYETKIAALYSEESLNYKTPLEIDKISLNLKDTERPGEADSNLNQLCLTK
jgi:transposase-like protein